MKQALLRATAALVVTALCGALAFAQVSTTGSISGTVADQAGAVVAGATVVIRNNDTGYESTDQTADNGTFSVASLPAGTYTITVTAPSFKKAVVQDVKVNVGSPSTVNIGLEVGNVGETVTITGAGGELLQTQTATVGTTITGRQITDIPFTSRDALDLVLLLPGTSTPGTPRTSTVNGLPKGSLNITIDGVNVQDNNLKSDFGGGFFTYIRPRIDAIDEVTVSTATPGAESAGEGAVQIKFVTRGGTNDLNGSLYWYHRNPAANANYYFNNLNGLPRDRVLLNQYGGRGGGPIFIPKVYDGRDRSFWFVNYEEYRLPEQTSRTRTILTPSAQAGIFTAANGRQVNLLAEAARVGCAACTSTVDPAVARVLTAIAASTSAGSITPFDANRRQFNFTNTGGQTRYFTTVRFDHNVTQNHRIENVWNYQIFKNPVDFLNGVDPAFPGFVAGVGGQNSFRWSNSSALRSNLSSSIVNEARFALTGGTSLFRAELAPGSYADLGGLALNINAAGLGLTNPHVSRSNQRRNSPVKTFSDNLTWVKGRHTMNIGGSFTLYSLWSDSLNNIVPQVNFGLDTSDPVNTALFNNLRDVNGQPITLSGTDLTLARGLYGLLTGRVTAVLSNAYPDEETGTFTRLGNSVVRLRQREYGIYAQDSFRWRPNLTVNFGLRWEVQEPFESRNNTLVQTSFDEVFGVSGPSGANTTFNLFAPGTPAYNTDYGNFAPSVGVAWSPNWRTGLLNRFFGEAGQTVLRAGYSVAYVREGLNVATSIFGANPGASLNTDRSITLGNLTAGSLLRDPATLVLPTFNANRTFPRTGAQNDSANVFEPDIEAGYVQSWTAGIQRELTKDMVVEVRYVSNRGLKLWQQINYNEYDVLRNGFINEFRLAQQNLAANRAAGRGNTFRYAGPGTGTSPLPILLAFLNGVAPANAGNCAAGTGTGSCAALYSSASFSDASFYNFLLPFNANPQALASLLDDTPARRTAGFTTAGLPRNIFLANPDLFGGAWVVTNRGRSWYDALQIDVRRRMAKGLLIQGNYTWGKSLTNMYGTSSSVAIQPPTLQDDRLSKVESSFDIRHALKVNWIYELPFGRGKMWGADANGLVNQLIGGWEWHGAFRGQSGTPFSFGNVQLVGMTKDELQDAIDIRRNGIQPNGAISPNPTFLPDDIILNTFRAFNFNVDGYTQGAPTGRYIAPASSHGCVQAFTGQCGFANLVLWGPKFFRTDMSVVKKFRITETTNFEFRTEFLNAFNNINFKIGGAGNESVTIGGFSTQTFGQTNQAYRDISTTNDPGGRIIQFVGRFNF